MKEENQLHIEDLIYWLNQARLNPQMLIPFLENHLQNFRNQKQLEISPHSFYQTFQGKKAWIEAIQFLENQAPLNPLVRHQGLNKSSEDHSKDLARQSATGEIGSDGSTLIERIKRYSQFESGIVGQTVAQQLKKKVRNHARQTVLSLIICDGDETRSDRRQIFNVDYRYFGVSVSESEIGYVTVIDYSSINLPQVNVSNVLGNKTNVMGNSNFNIKKTISVLTNDSENSYPSVNNSRSNVQRIY